MCLPVVVGVVVCFLVLACVYCPECGVVGVGACFGLGISVVMDEHTVGFTFNTVLASAIVVVVARIAC